MTLPSTVGCRGIVFSGRSAVVLGEYLCQPSIESHLSTKHGNIASREISVNRQRTLDGQTDNSKTLSLHLLLLVEAWKLDLAA